MRMSRNLLDLERKVSVSLFVLNALMKTGYAKFSSHYYIGTDRVASYFSLSRRFVTDALRKGKLKGVKERGCWKVWTCNALDFVLLENLKKILEKEKYRPDFKEIEKLTYKELKKIFKNRY